MISLVSNTATGRVVLFAPHRVHSDSCTMGELMKNRWLQDRYLASCPDDERPELVRVFDRWKRERVGR